MSVPFVNRTGELAALQRWWDADERAAIVWGRRRVGKTALVQHFAAGIDAPVVFHTGVGAPAADETAALSRRAAALGHPVRDLAGRPYSGWDDALDDLAGLAADRPVLLVLDEFPELVRGAPELPGQIRALLDRTAGRTRLRLLLCGSAVRHMEGMQEERAPLYGRFDLALQVHPFAPHESALLLPGLPAEEQALVHGLVGGIPLYLSWWDTGGSVSENLGRLACTPGGRLLTEGELVLATEADHGDLPAAVLRAVATGRTTHNEIKNVVRAEPTRTLERLAALRLIERVVPVTESARSRRAYYRVADHLLAFHLHLLSRYRSEIERGLGPAILPVLVEGLDDLLGHHWEEMVRGHLRRRAAGGDPVPGIVAVGRWWSGDGQTEIDAVALAGRSRTPVLVAEAKWARRVDGARLAARLRTRAAAVPGADAEGLHLALAARTTVTDPPPGTTVITARDVMGGLTVTPRSPAAGPRPPPAGPCRSQRG